MTEDEFLNAGGAAGMSAASPAVPTGISEAEFIAAPSTAPQPPGLGARALRGAELVASGFNQPWETLVGAPVDLATAAINKLYSTATGAGAAPAGAYRDITGEAPPAPLISEPFGGSEMLRRMFSQTQPEGTGERLLYGAGAGVGSVVGPGAVGAGLRAGGAALPAISEAMLPPVTAGGAAIGGIAGTGGAGAREFAEKAGAPPLVQTLAELGGGMAAAGPAALAARAAPQIVRPLTQAGQQAIAGRVLGETTTMTPSEIEAAAQAAPSGVRPSLGDVTGEQPVQTLQRAMTGRDLALGGRMQQLATDNNQTILDAFDQVGKPGSSSPYELSQQAADRLEATRKAQQGAASGAFKAVPSDQTMVPTAPLLDAYTNYAGQLGPARQRFLPDTYQDLLTGYGDQEPLGEIQNFSSALKNEARAAASGASPDYNRANVLSGLHDALFPGGGPEDLLTPAQGPVGDALRNARAQWQAYKQTYSDAPAVARVLRPDAPGSAALDQLLGPGAGQSERAAQFVAAAQNDPQTLQTARDWFAAKMRAAGGVAGQDLQGDQYLNGNLLRRFRDNNQPLLDSPLFDDTQRQAVNGIVDAGNMMGRTARAGTPGGSDTFRNLTTERYLQGLGLGPGARSVVEAAPGLVGTGIGAGVGSLFGPMGALVGAGVGGGVGGGTGALGRNLVAAALPYERARERVLSNVAGGLIDPVEAARLMRLGAPAAAPAGPASPLRSYMALPAAYGAFR